MIPWQVANAYPDINSSYFVGQFYLPENARIELAGYYGNIRYFSYTVANQLGGGSQGNGHYIRDEFIQPDAESINPFVPGNSRDIPHKQRKYTMHILPGVAPENQKDMPPNTLFTGTTDKEGALTHLALRSYLPDDGTTASEICPCQGLK